jgi:hypothetical protein
LVLERLKFRGAFEQNTHRFVGLLRLRSKGQAKQTLFMRRTRHQGEVVCFAPRLELLIRLETTLQAEVESEIVLPFREPMVILEEGQQLLAGRVRLASTESR